MKPLQSAIVVSVMVASLTVALKARADDDVRSGAWSDGRAAGAQCAASGSSCKFAYPYPQKSDDADDTSDQPTTEAQATYNADYVAGFIVGKSEANSK